MFILSENYSIIYKLLLNILNLLTLTLFSIHLYLFIKIL